MIDRETATRIIRNTFEKTFDKTQFINFSKNLVNYLDSSGNFSYQGNYIPDAYKPYIQTLERIGQYQDSDSKTIEVLIVQLKKETSLEHARTMQRNFIAWYLDGSRGGELRDAALVAVISPDSEDWRFSLVKMEYSLGLSEKTGRLKTEKLLTPARRYSFLVGSNESSHTAQIQLLPILQDDKNNPTLTELENAFSIEVVTKEFFEKYRELFHKVEESLQKAVNQDKKIKEDFDAKDVNTINFSKKLLGQIVFLYFLQKKGWLGVPENESWGNGDRRFLRTLFSDCQKNKSSYFNDYLEHLFYDALNNQNRGGIDPSYYPKFGCRIPFLNGGLFDPINNYDWMHTDIHLSNELFSNNEKTKEGDTGTGILDIFDRYNFTVKEDEPLDKEVAVDPEMLGQVFENLLEVKDRKSKGTYYTPREIVHYMCQESLINYLDTAINTGDVALVGEKPTNLKLFGAPAFQQRALKTPGSTNRVPRVDIETLIHSGDLVTENDTRVQNNGKETERYSYKLPASIRQHAALIDEKLADVRVCDPAVGSGAFPVGLMTEIVRARNTLTTYLPDITERSYYNFKRHAIQNCLYGVDIDPGATEIAKLRLWLSLVVDEEDIKQIRPLPNLDYKIVCGNSLLGVERNMFNNELFQKLEELKPLYFNETNAKKKQTYKNDIDSLISEITHDKQKFDFEVYFSEIFHEKSGFDIVIANPPYGADIDNNTKVYAKLYPNTTKYYKDIYKIFIEKAIASLLSNGSIMTYILPNTLLTQPRYRDARGFLIKYRIVELVNLGEEVFEATVPTCVIIVQKTSDSDKLKFADLSINCKFLGNLHGLQYQIIEQEDFTKSAANIFVSNKRGLNEDEEPLAKILIFRDAGINYQRVNVGLSEKGKSDLGQRLLYEGIRKNAKDIEYWKGSDIDAFYCKKETNRFVHIAVTKKLRPNERVILNEEFFSTTPKLIWRQTATYPIATIDQRGIWFGRSIQAAILRPGKDKEYSYKYILALLNSNYLRYLYTLSVKETGRVFPQVKLANLETLPIKTLSLQEQKPFINLVDDILDITEGEDYPSNASKRGEVIKLEGQIDQLIYNLYRLTPDERAVVDGVSK